MTDPKPTPADSRRSFSSDFKLFFLRGLVVLLPSILTLWILVKAYQFVDSAIAEPINGGIRWVLYQATPHIKILKTFEATPDQMELERVRIRTAGVVVPEDDILASDIKTQNITDWWESWWWGVMDLIGILVAITAVYFAGRLLGGFVGRRLYRRLEAGLVQLPIVKQVYPYVKQVVDFLFGQDKQIEFKRVVLVEYPRKGIWSIGLLTGAAMRSVSESVKNESVTVFIPSSPTPFTGYTISVPRTDIVDLPISIDEALRFTISGGVLMPERQTPPQLAGRQVQQPPAPTPEEPTGSNGGDNGAEGE